MTTHGYWAKDSSEELGGSQKYAREETEGFAASGKYFWQVQEYDPKTPPIDVFDNNKLLPFGARWYADNGKLQSDLVKGERIYVAQQITNRHQMAYYLAVEATKKEIELLYQSASGVKVGTYNLRDIYKMDEDELMVDNRIKYRTKYDKMP